MSLGRTPRVSCGASHVRPRACYRIKNAALRSWFATIINNFVRSACVCGFLWHAPLSPYAHLAFHMFAFPVATAPTPTSPLCGQALRVLTMESICALSYMRPGCWFRYHIRKRKWKQETENHWTVELLNWPTDCASKYVTNSSRKAVCAHKGTQYWTA